MDNNFFKKIRILDGGMGQLLLEKGMVSMGTLWSASALLDEKYHQMLVDTIYHISTQAQMLLLLTPLVVENLD